VGDSVAEKRGASAAVGVGADLIVSQKSCDLNDCLANFNTCAELVIRRGAISSVQDRAMKRVALCTSIRRVGGLSV